MNLILRMVILACGFLALCPAKGETLVWEAEAYQEQVGTGFSAMKLLENPAKNVSGKRSRKVSGNRVLVLPGVAPNIVDRPPAAVSYRLRVPKAGVYYLWARTLWYADTYDEMKYCTYFTVTLGQSQPSWRLGGDRTFQALHWVSLMDRNDDNLQPLKLPKGIATLTIAHCQNPFAIDEFLLTTSPKLQPMGAITPTHTLAKDRKALVPRPKPNK